MKTYWLNGKKDIQESDMPQCPFLVIMQEEVRSRQAEETADTARAADDMGSQAALHSYSPVSFKDMRTDAASPLPPVHAGSGAAAAAGLLGLDGNGSIVQHPNHHAERSNSPKVNSVSSTPRKNYSPKCPFSSGRLDGNEAGQGSHMNGPSSRPVTTSACPNTTGPTRPGLTSLDSGISITGPTSALQDTTGTATDGQVPKVNIIRPSQTSVTIPNSHNKSLLITDSENNAEGKHGSKDHSLQSDSSPPSQSSPTSQHQTAKSPGFTGNKNDSQSVEGRSLEEHTKIPLEGNGNITVGKQNGVAFETQHSKNGSHTLHKDDGLVSGAMDSKPGSSKKSRMCHVL